MSNNTGPGMLAEMMSQVNNAGGFARQNRYNVIIPINLLTARSTNIFNLNSNILEFSDIEATDWIQSYFGSDTSAEKVRLQAFCEKSELPGYQFQMETNCHYGPSFKIPHTPEYQDITMTFMCGSDMFERYIFDAWMYLVMDPETNNFNYIDEYALDIDITSYNEMDGDPDRDIYGKFRSQTSITAADRLNYNYTTTLIEAYPIAMSAQDLAYDANNTIQKLSVTFTYKFAIPFNGKGAKNGRQLRGTQQNFGNSVTLTPGQ